MALMLKGVGTGKDKAFLSLKTGPRFNSDELLFLNSAISYSPGLQTAAPYVTETGMRGTRASLH